MFRSAHTGAFLLLTAVLFPGKVSSQESPDFHQFTDKKGQTVSAMLLEVSPDRQQMKIRREDGQEFETVINLLSLDDQQYVKDWMKKAPMTAAAQAEFRLDVVLTRQTGSVEKRSESSIRLESRPSTFRVALRNLSRDSLEGARLEYALVWEDRTTIYQTEAETWTYTSGSDEDGASHRVKKTGKFDLEPLRFNGEATLETPAVDMEQVFIGDNNPYREDEMLGVRVRIIGADGIVIHETHSGGAVLAAMGWDEILALPDPMVVN
jgi:hypothetical protein